MTSKYYSPLRYPGGKSSLYDFLLRSIEYNRISNPIYVEGFAGGAGAALKLLMLEQVDDIYLNDKDVFIYKFWKSVLNNTDELCKLISDSKPTVKNWKFRNSVLNSKARQDQMSDVQIGFTAFFLNRCNRSGILRSGPIGGHDQSGEWKIDARYNKAELVKRIEKIALYKERIKLYNLDIISFLKKMENEMEDKSNVLLYLDPPYVLQGKELYRHYFNDGAHRKLAGYLQKESTFNWIVSYDDNPLIHQVYKEVTKNIFEFNYFVNRTKVGRELVICSKQFALPKIYNHYSREKELVIHEPASAAI